MRDPRVTTEINDDENENVFDLVEKPDEEFEKSPRYQSVHKKRTKFEFARIKSSHKTLGQPKVPLNPPSEYLKKYSRIVPKRPKVTHVHYRKPDYIHQLPKWKPVKPPEKPCIIPPLPKDPALVGRVNFRKRNIEDVKKYEKKPHNYKTVDTRKGDVQELVPHGLMPIYIYKKNYGDVPKMLKRGPKLIPKTTGNKCNADYKNYTAQSETTSIQEQDSKQDSNKKPSCRYITEEERANLLEDMQKKRAEMMKTFQCLPFLIDTAAKIKRKKNLETKLKQLENDMELVENHQFIYVF